MTTQDPTQYLAAWLVRYLKNRDLAFRKIVTISTTENQVLVQEKDKNIAYLILPSVDDFEPLLQNLASQVHKGIVVYNTAKNLAALLRSWKKLTSIDHLTIFFVNPFSLQEKRWIIQPKTHHLICDEENLKEVVQSLFGTVDEVDMNALSGLIARDRTFDS